jgi:predicted nucleic acid-binding protein
MTAYFDTGIILKLYTEETASPAVRAFVVARRKAVPIHDFHLTECTTALRLKHFRGECDEKTASSALAHIMEDIRNGVLRVIPIDWGETWRLCRSLANDHAGQVGCRTLDTLHVASACLLGAREFVTSDGRQTALANLLGLTTINPCLA